MPPPKKYLYLPVEQYVAYDEVPVGLVGKILPKIEEVISALPGNQTLADADVDAVKSLVTLIGETSRYYYLLQYVHFLFFPL